MDDLNLLFNEEQLRKKLKAFDSPERVSWDDNDFVHSAIIFLLIPHENEPYDLVLIRRTKRANDKHSGEMGFPGGIFERKTDKSYQDTALRELEEELGVPRGKVNLLGCIDDMITPKGYIIKPFVAWIDENQKLVKEEKEVQEIVKIPISFFVNKKNYRERTFKVGDETLAVGKYKFKKGGETYVVFGATTHLIVNFIDIVYGVCLIAPGCRRGMPKDFRTQREKLKSVVSKVKSDKDVKSFLK